jgi:hypothetical protein
MSLPFALALSDPRGSGLHTYVATFREFADLWTFWQAWRAEVEPATDRESLFVHTGRAVRIIRPRPDEREAFEAWAADMIARDRG